MSRNDDICINRNNSPSSCMYEIKISVETRMNTKIWGFVLGRSDRPK
ncbi:hypothetical protein [Planktothricoides raciborskii]|nr:hypothetical protein [Planktothricoides raciborskii]